MPMNCSGMGSSWKSAANLKPEYKKIVDTMKKTRDIWKTAWLEMLFLVSENRANRKAETRLRARPTTMGNSRTAEKRRWDKNTPGTLLMLLSVTKHVFSHKTCKYGF